MVIVYAIALLVVLIRAAELVSADDLVDAFVGPHLPVSDLLLIRGQLIDVLDMPCYRLRQESHEYKGSHEAEKCDEPGREGYYPSQRAELLEAYGRNYDRSKEEYYLRYICMVHLIYGAQIGRAS